ncbi:MAG TPA: class I SAM-dependent methyltransferase [Acidimicrobiales bacterium]|nr:class I SAM-dependent methyltransferase [Acidimicrobiales bacterium]
MPADNPGSSSGTPTDGPSADAVALFALKVWEYKQGESVSLMIHLGDRLGLYRAMAGRGPMTAGDLSAATGLHERWLLEWLRSQAAAGLVTSADGVVFELPPEAAPVLSDEGASLWFAAGAFSGAAATPDVVEGLARAFRTGTGLSYDDLGPSAAHQVERMLGPWSRLALVPVILPALEGVVERLRQGARVVDVGCGAGVALLAMAEAFPNSSFEGYDPSVHAIARARDNVARSGLDNIRLVEAPAENLPGEPTYDLVLTLDCLHDMPRPAEAARSIRRALKPEGTWLVKEIRSAPEWSTNLKNPLLAMMYATSVSTCMSSAMSEPGGAGLGTLGLDPERLETLCTDAGFDRFKLHDFEDPANLYYEVRP